MKFLEDDVEKSKNSFISNGLHIDSILDFLKIKANYLPRYLLRSILFLSSGPIHIKLKIQKLKKPKNQNA